MKRLLPFLLFLTIIAGLSAQISELQIVGTPEQLESEIVSVRDANGRFCAAIQMISDMEGFSYDSYNGVVRVDDQPGKDMVFLSPDERVLEILHTGYTPLKIILSEIGIQLSEREVWKIQISGQRRMMNIPVVIIANPGGAEVVIDGVSRGAVERVNLSGGTHQLTLNKVGYESVIQTITVDENNNLFKFDLQRVQEIPIEITTTPSGADVYIDGLKFGTTPLSDFFFSGKHRIRIEKESYLAYEDMVDFTPPRLTQTIQLRPGYGSIQVTSEPESGLDIYLNGELQNNKTPYTFSRLSPGQYRFRAGSGMYQTEEDTVEIRGGESLKVTLHAVEQFAMLTIKTLPGATVYLNGQRIETLENIRLEPMMARIRVEKPPKSEPVEQRVPLRNGDVRTVEIYPEMHTATLQVAVMPFDATIELSGDAGEFFTAERSHVFQDIPVGEYRLKVAKDGFETQEETLQLEIGDKIKRSISLIQEQDLTAEMPEEPVLQKKSRNWLYYSLGAAAIIGGGAAYYITQVADQPEESGPASSALATPPAWPD